MHWLITKHWRNFVDNALHRKVNKWVTARYLSYLFLHCHDLLKACKPLKGQNSHWSLKTYEHGRHIIWGQEPPVLESLPSTCTSSNTVRFIEIIYQIFVKYRINAHHNHRRIALGIIIRSENIRKALYDSRSSNTN